MKTDIFVLLFIVLVVASVWFLMFRSSEASAEPLSSSGEPRKLLTEVEFKERVISEVLSRDPTLQVAEVDPQNIDIHIAYTDDPVSVFVGGFYAKYVAEPSQLDNLIFEFSGMIMEAVSIANGDEFTISSDQLAVVLRHEDYLGYIDPEVSVWQRFHGDLIAMMVFKNPNYVVNAKRSDLEKIELSLSEGWSQAADNIRHRWNDLVVVAEKAGAKALTADSGLATGHLWLMCQEPNSQDFDAMVINKETYIYAEMQDQIATTALAGIAAKLVIEDDTLSENIVSCLNGQFYASRLDGNRWTPILD